MIRFTVPGEPKPLGRPRVNQTTKSIYTPSEDKAYQKKVSAAYHAAYGKQQAFTADEPLAVVISAYCGIAKTTSKKKRLLIESGAEFPKKGDIDNIVKNVLDGMSRHVFPDDSQIVQIGARKAYSDEPHVTVIIRNANEVVAK